MTIPEPTDEQLAEALRTAKPADPNAVQRAQAEAQRALDAAFDLIRSAASDCVCWSDR